MSKPNGTILKANDFQVRGNKVLINLNKKKIKVYFRFKDEF